MQEILFLSIWLDTLSLDMAITIQRFMFEIPGTLIQASTYSMTWGGSYDNMQMLSVSIVHLASTAPAAFNKTSPSNNAINQGTRPTLRWQTSARAVEYEYCYNTTQSCSNWLSAGLNTYVVLPELNGTTTYYWQVRAVNSADTTYANTGTWWQFTTLDPAIFNRNKFHPTFCSALTKFYSMDEKAEGPGQRSKKI